VGVLVVAGVGVAVAAVVPLAADVAGSTPWLADGPVAAVVAVVVVLMSAAPAALSAGVRTALFPGVAAVAAPRSPDL
jgi:hypothetical protein